MSLLLTTLIAQGTGDGSLGGPIQGVGPIGDTSNLGDVGSATTLFESQLSNIIGFFTIVGGLFFLIQFLTAGFDWLTAGGDKGKVEKSKDKMTNSAIGLLIMVLATAIVGVVGGVFGIDILNPGAIFQNLVPNQ